MARQASHPAMGMAINQKKKLKEVKPIKILLVIVFTCLVSGIQAQTVYTTKTGEKYHKSSCRYLKNSKYERELSDALAYGYDPCSVCKPPTKTTATETSTSNLTQENTTSTKSSNNKSTATQCTGKTKAGKRCKRMTKSANGRCYQH